MGNRSLCYPSAAPARPPPQRQGGPRAGTLALQLGNPQGVLRLALGSDEPWRVEQGLPSQSSK